MSAEFLAGKPEAFVVRATKLARVLDEKFDGFGTLIADEALDHAALILEAIEERGCTLVFPDEAVPGNPEWSGPMAETIAAPAAFLPCPFCGQYPEVERTSDEVVPLVVVRCMAFCCNVSPSVVTLTEVEALASWNMRAPVQP